MLIHVKENEQTVRTNYVVVLTMQNAHPYFEWNRLSDENKAGKCRLLAWFDQFKVHICEIIDV